MSRLGVSSPPPDPKAPLREVSPHAHIASVISKQIFFDYIVTSNSSSPMAPVSETESKFLFLIKIKVKKMSDSDALKGKWGKGLLKFTEDRSWGGPARLPALPPIPLPPLSPPHRSVFFPAIMNPRFFLPLMLPENTMDSFTNKRGSAGQHMPQKRARDRIPEQDLPHALGS